MNTLLISIVMSALSHITVDNTVKDTSAQKITIPAEHSFHSVVIYNDELVFIKEGTENEIIVNSEEDANNIKYKVNDGVLVIRGKKNFLSTNKPVKMIITVKNINSIVVMDDAEVRSVGELSYRNLKLEIYGDGAIYVNTRAIEVNTFIKGLGKIVVKGNFKNTTVNKDAYGNMITIYN